MMEYDWVFGGVEVTDAELGLTTIVVETWVELLLVLFGCGAAGLRAGDGSSTRNTHTIRVSNPLSESFISNFLCTEPKLVCMKDQAG